MKTFTFEEMVKKFGVGYYMNFNTVQEAFIGCSYRDHEDYSCTSDAAKRKYIAEVETQHNKEIARLDGLLARIHASPWYKKGVKYWVTGGRSIKNAYNRRVTTLAEELEDKKKWAQNLPVNYLDKGEYTLFLPDLSVGDYVYISVTHDNYFSVGVHQVEVVDIKYHHNFSDGNNLSYKAKGVARDGKELRLTTSHNKKDQLCTGYTYHEVHLNKEEAIVRVKEHLEAQMQTVKQQIAAMAE